MKTKLLIGLFCGAALSMQAQLLFTPFGTSSVLDLNTYVYGNFITPTTTATVADLSGDPWFGSSDLAKQWAAGYAQALFNWAKYNDPTDVDRLPLVYFAFHADDATHVDTWTFDIGRDQYFQENGNSVNLLLGLDPGAPGHGGYPVYSTPDTVSTAGLMVLALGGLAIMRVRKAT